VDDYRKLHGWAVKLLVENGRTVEVNHNGSTGRRKTYKRKDLGRAMARLTVKF
jgi:hypothetical protein